MNAPDHGQRSAGARRSDDEWLADLASTDEAIRGAALVDLQEMLLRGLAASLSKRGKVDDAFLEDIVQESLLKILDKLSSFEGRSKFRTWAVTIAVRTAVSSMRRKEWGNVSLDALTADANFDPGVSVGNLETAEDRARQSAMFLQLHELIESELSEKQWTAITAELRGMPLAEVAEKQNTNPNALYKVLHDARKKLRRGLEAAGFTIDDVKAALNRGA
ncbi:MAG: sigma-70 family RNA polymerase sigma factor [Planctomycetota bacterium]